MNQSHLAGVLSTYNRSNAPSPGRFPALITASFSHRWSAPGIGLLLSFLLFCGRAWTAENTNQAPGKLTIDLASPPLMTGTFYEIGSHRKTILFKYQRQAMRQGDLITVHQTFTLPDGTVACREIIHYHKNQLASYLMEDVRAHTRGSIVIEPDPKKSAHERMLLEHWQGDGKNARVSRNSELLQTNTLISDTIYPHILEHWDELMHGNPVKFHFISLDPAATFNFRLVLEPPAPGPDQSVVVVKMEPTNLILAHWIRPIFFSIEKSPPHRVFSYTGRTTPRLPVDGKWKYADAEAVFDWP